MENAAARRGKPSPHMGVGVQGDRERRYPSRKISAKWTLQVCPSVKQFLKDAWKAERERIKAAGAQFLTSKKGASQ